MHKASTKDNAISTAISRPPQVGARTPREYSLPGPQETAAYCGPAHGYASTVVSRSYELEDLEGPVHGAAGLAAGFGDVASAGEMVGADREVAQAGHDAGS